MTTWMVVEDEPELYDMVLAMYNVLGIDGKAFSTGEDAVDWIEDVDQGQYTDELPELMLLDIRLPGKIQGPYVGERMRKSPVLGKMAIILMTGYKLDARQEKEVKKVAGANLLLYKPLPKIKEFQQIVKKLIR